MGHEILYCSVCAERILGADLERGKAVKSGHQAACAKCAPAFRAPAPPPVPPARKEFGSATPVPPRRTPSTVRMPMAEPSRGLGSAAPWIGGVAGIVVLVVIGIAASSAGKPAPVREAVSKVEARRSPPSPVPPPTADAGRAQVAEKAVLVARAATAAGDVESAFEAWDAALRASDRTPWNVEASMGYQAAMDRRRAVWKATLEEAEKAIQASFERGDADAWKAVLARLGAKHRGQEWDAKVGDLSARVSRAAADLVARAHAARPWIPLFDGKSNEFLRGECRDAYRVEGGVLVKLPLDNAAQTRREFSSGEFRFRFEAQGLESAYFSALQSAKGVYRVTIAGERIRVGEGGVREIVLVVKDGKAGATLNGAEVPVEKIGTPETGPLQFNGRAASLRVLAVDYRE